MILKESVNDKLRLIHTPFPLGADGIGMMSPAEDALVGARQTRSCLHAPVRFNAVKSVLETRLNTSYHGIKNNSYFCTVFIATTLAVKILNTSKKRITLNFTKR